MKQIILGFLMASVVFCQSIGADTDREMIFIPNKYSIKLRREYVLPQGEEYAGFSYYAPNHVVIATRNGRKIRFYEVSAPNGRQAWLDMELTERP